MGDPGRSGKNSRLFVEAVLLIARTGSLWRDLPAAFGHWNSAYTRFRHCVKGGCLRSQRADSALWLSSGTRQLCYVTRPHFLSTVTPNFLSRLGLQGAIFPRGAHQAAPRRDKCHLDPTS